MQLLLLIDVVSSRLLSLAKLLERNVIMQECNKTLLKSSSTGSLQFSAPGCGKIFRVVGSSKQEVQYC